MPSMAAESDDVRSKELLFLLAENSNDVVWTMSASGEITYVSPSVERMRGFTVEEAMRQPLDEILAPESAAISAGYFMDIYVAIQEGREPPGDFRGELEYLCADGSTVWTEVQALPRYAPDGSLIELLGISRDISELREQRAAVRDAQIDAERQRTLLEERERLARDLHDDLLQSLTAANLDIATAELRAGDADGTRAALLRSREDIETAMESARRLVSGLRARQLEGRSLADAVRLLVAAVEERAGVRATFSGSDLGDLDDVVEETLFRVAQEALMNVMKHAEATEARVLLERDGNGVELTVVDDGRGIETEGTEAGDRFGLAGMRERVDRVGGALSVEREAGGGTRVVARVPVAS